MGGACLPIQEAPTRNTQIREYRTDEILHLILLAFMQNQFFPQSVGLNVNNNKKYSSPSNSDKRHELMQGGRLYVNAGTHFWDDWASFPVFLRSE